MPKGSYPVEYFSPPQIDKPLDEAYGDLDAYLRQAGAAA